MMAVQTNDAVPLPIIFATWKFCENFTNEDNFNYTLPSTTECWCKNSKSFFMLASHCKQISKCMLKIRHPYYQYQFQPTFSLIFVMGIVRTKIVKKVGRRQNLNRDYKNIPPQKMSPSSISETQHIISLQNLLLPQPKIAFGNGYAIAKPVDFEAS